MIELLNQPQKELGKYLQDGKFKYTDYVKRIVRNLI